MSASRDRSAEVSGPVGERGPRRGLRLLDLAALVISYGLAALLVRAFAPRDEPTPLAVLGMVAFVYTWLGLAMGGPLVLLIDRRAQPEGRPPDAAPRYTWAETAWLLIGGYWIGLALFVVPSKLPVNPLLGVFPVLAALGLRLFGRRLPPSDARRGWTHAAAIAVLLFWPAAWVAMILLGRSQS